MEPQAKPSLMRIGFLAGGCYLLCVIGGIIVGLLSLTITALGVRPNPAVVFSIIGFAGIGIGLWVAFTILHNAGVRRPLLITLLSGVLGYPLLFIGSVVLFTILTPALGKQPGNNTGNLLN